METLLAQIKDDFVGYAGPVQKKGSLSTTTAVEEKVMCVVPF